LDSETLHSCVSCKNTSQKKNTKSENAQSRELRTLLVGQIARAAAVFQIDEIVVYDDGMTSTKAKGAAESGWNPNDFMARLLQVCNKLVKCHAFHTTCNTCFNITIMRTVIDK
jgi:Putative RNA methyltransferase